MKWVSYFKSRVSLGIYWSSETIYRKQTKRFYSDLGDLSMGFGAHGNYSTGMTQDLRSKEPTKTVKICSGLDNTMSRKGY